MKASRLFFSSLALLILLLAAAGAYLYPRLPSMVEAQAAVYLADYGVQELELGPLRPSASALQTDKLRLAGAIEGLAFDLSLEGVELAFDVRELWRGRARSLELAQLRLRLREVPSALAGGTSAFALSDLLPQRLLSSLPLQSLAVSQWQIAYQPLQGDEITARGSLRWAGGSMTLPFETVLAGLQLRAELVAGQGDSFDLLASAVTGDDAIGRVTLSGALHDTQRWRWQASGEFGYTPLLAWLGKLGLEQQAVLAPIELGGFSKFEAQLQHADELSPPGDATAQFISQFDGSVNMDNTLSRVSYDPVLTEGVGAVEARLHLDRGDVEVILGPAQFDARLATSLLQLPQDTRQWLRWQETVSLRWREPGQTRIWQSSEDSWTLEAADNRLLLGDSDSQVKFSAISLEAELQALQSAVSLAADMDIRLRQKSLPQMRLLIDQRGPPQASAVELRLGDIAESLAFSLDGQFNAESGQGTFLAELRSLDLPYAVSTLVPLLQKFDLLQQTLAVDSGSFTLASELRSGGFELGQLTQSATLGLTGVSGSYGEYRFQGIDASARWTGVEQWQTLEPATLSMARLDVGFDVTDTFVALVLPRPTPLAEPVVRLERFESGMFGGRVFLPRSQRWDFSSSSNNITLRAEDFRLADIVSLQQGQDIQAEGILEGELPVTVSDRRIIIDKGYLRARAPGGSIRYVANAASQALAQSSPELGIALGLLEDFQYQALGSDVQLDRQGNLLLGLSLEGRNQAHYEGRTIRFNINLEQNLDPLLQSLRLSDNLVEKVEQGLR